MRTTLPGCPGANGRAPGWADYFPAGIFDDRPDDFRNDFTPKWFGGELAARGEPVLSCPRPGAAEAYRLLFLPSFAPTWVVRVERSADGAELQATKVPFDDDADASAPTPPPTERRFRRLSRAEWDRLAAALTAADFWKLPPPETLQGEDGETWIVEGLRPGAYHAVERWEPTGGTPYRALGATFLELAGLGSLAVVPAPILVKPTAPEDLPSP